MPAETCKTILLSDKPAETDAFAGSHDRLASAVADLIRNEDGGRAAALTGNWGSGKSTTIQLLKSRLANKAEVFVFNAWSHQGDPLRRTFLEQLIDFVDSLGWVNDRSYWEDVKKDLARRRRVQDIKSTPKLNRDGKILVVLLLLVPVGLAMFSRLGEVDHWIAFLGALLSLAPAVFVVSVFLWRLAFGKKTDIFEILLKESTVTTKSETIETPEPTSIEFQKHFRDLLASCLNEPNRKLVIVIDNLDRIDAKNALALWSTMSTFFDFSPAFNSDWLKSLWLLVPFDPAALAKLWPDAVQAGNSVQPSDTTDDLARVFVDKTFAITFHVPPPVRSDWRSYLIDQLKQALPDHAGNADKEFHVVYRLYQLAGLKENRSPTPRDIKVFVNNLGAIHRQRCSEIELPLQALYVVLSSKTWDLEEKLRTATDDELLGTIPVSFVGADFRASLAAIYFNASSKKALQLLHREKTESALLSGDGEKLQAFKDIYGITQVIEEITDSAAEWIKTDASSLALAARALSNSGIEEDSSLRETWRMLCDATVQVKAWPKVSSEIGDGIVAIFNYRKQEDLAKAIVLSLATSSTGNGKADAPEEPINSGPWVATASKVLTAIQSEFPQALQNFSVPGSATNYVSVMSELGKAAELSGVEAFFAPSGALKDIIDELIKASSTEGEFDDSKANAVRAMLWIKKEWPWAKFIQQLRTRLTADNSPNVSEIKASLLTLLRLRSIQPEAAKALTFLAEQGHLEHQLYQSNQAKDQKAVALCVLPILETIPDGVPTGTPGNASTGQNVYTEFIGNPSARPELVTETSDLLLKFGHTEVLFELAKKSDTKVIAQAILKEIVNEPEGHELIAPTAIIEQFEVLKTACEQPALEELVKKSITNASLIDELTKGGFKSDMSDLYLFVLGCDKENSALLGFLHAGLKDIEQNTWTSELTADGELIKLLIELVKIGQPLDLGIPFQDALLAHAKDVLEGKAKVERSLPEWQQVSKALSSSFQETFFQRLTELLYSDSSVDPILELYGESLLNESILSENAERLVLTAFANFLARANTTELNWMARAFRAKPDLLSEVKSATKKDFTGRVVEVYEKSEGNDSLRTAIEEMAKLAKIRLPAPKEKTEDDKKEKKKEESK